jgi:FAD:protein FMN transferase
MTRISRRRALFIGAAAAGVALAPVARATMAHWRGIALGADAQIQLRHVSDEEAAPLFAAIEAELARLEAIFSLYRPESALSRLNRTGELETPPPEMIELLTLARGVHRGTDGLFDPTVQPLFRLYAEASASLRVVSSEELEETLGLVGLEHVKIASERLHFERPGMSLTLNGIAQGFITDRIAGLLRGEGLRDVLVNMGEIAAVGSDCGGSGWNVRIEGFTRPVQLKDRAIATSAPLGTIVDPVGNIGHILDPRFGWVAARQRQVSVVADTAALADALSTAGALMTADQLAGLDARGFETYSLPV